MHTAELREGPPRGRKKKGILKEKVSEKLERETTQEEREDWYGEEIL